MTLRELLGKVEPTIGQKLPMAAALESGDSPMVVEQAMEDGSSLRVYQNGFALFKVNRRRTVFRVDHCGGYRYFSGTEQITLTEEEFAEMDWWVRLLLEAEDRVTHNRDVGIAHYEMSFHSESIQFAPMVSRSKQPVDALIQREQIETALRQMTKRQREVALNYYIYGYSVQEIGDRYGISHQAVSVTLSAVRKKLKRFF